MNAYQQNLKVTSPAANKSYTTSDIYGIIARQSEYNSAAAQDLYRSFQQQQQDSRSQFYNPYSQATNKSVRNLAAYGIDTSRIDDDFFARNDYLRQYLTYDGTTNSPTKPGKRASAQQKAAYEYYQIWKSEDATKKAETQWQALQDELSYWATCSDRNYSDEQIINRIDWSKYSELVKMDQNGAFMPNEYNRAIGYSQDAMRGVLWAARNGKSIGGSGMGVDTTGRYGMGNIDLNNRQVVKNPDGSISTERSFSTNIDGKEVLLPTVIYGKIVSEAQAINHYLKTGENLGIFDNVDEANRYAEILHERQNAFYNTSEVSLEYAMGMSALGEGNQWKFDPTIYAKLDAGNAETYSPYEVGSTMEKERLYFGVDSFDRQWIEDHRAEYLGGNDETAKKYYANVVEAVEYTEKLNQQLADMYEQINGLMLGISNPDDIIAIIQDNDEYKDLFALDKTLETGELKNTASAVNYRWKDMEQIIRDACAKLEEARSSGEFVDVMTGTPDTESGKLLQQYYRDCIGKQYPTMKATGTDAEIAAVETGKVDDFDGAYDAITNATVTPDKSANDITQSVVNDMNGLNDTIYTYDQRKVHRDQAQQELDATAQEYEYLNELYTSDQTYENITSEEYQNLQNLKNLEGDPEWDVMKVILANGNQQDREMALQYIYEHVRPNEVQYDQQSMLAQAEQFWNIILKENYQTPSTPIQQEIDAMQGDVDDGMELSFDLDVPYDGGYRGEDADTELRVFLRNEDGKLVFDHAEGNAGGYYDTQEDADKLFGYEAPDSNVWMTQEQLERYQMLDARRSELETVITEDDDWLALHEADYEDATNDKTFLMEAWAAAAAVSKGELDSTLIPKLNYAYTIGREHVPTQYSSYFLYDNAVMNGTMSKEDAFVDAASSVVNNEYEAQMLTELLQSLDSYGAPISDEQRKNIEARIQALNEESMNCAYFMIDGAEDYEEQTSKGKAMAANANSSIAKLLSYEGEIPDRFSDDWNAWGDLARMGAIDENTMYIWKNTLNYITDEEKNRYFYLLATSGSEAADQYFNMLTDPNKGALTVRSSEMARHELADFASQNGLNAARATVASFASNVLGGPVALLYEAITLAQGGEISPYNAAFGLQNATTSFREGSKEWIGSVFGENSVVPEMLYDALTSHVDSLINAKLTTAAFKVVGDVFGKTKLGQFIDKFLGNISEAESITRNGGEITDKALSSQIGKFFGNHNLVAGLTKFGVKAAGDLAHASTMGLNAASAAYRDAILRGGNSDQALAMFWATFWAETGSEAVTFSNLHDSFMLGSDAEKRSLTEFVKAFFKNGAEEFFGEGINEWAEQNADRIIMGAMSEYEQTVKSYTDKGYPEAVAKKIADKELWTNILKSGAIGFLSSGMGTTVEYTEGALREWANRETPAAIPGSNGNLTTADVNNQPETGMSQVAGPGTSEQVLRQQYQDRKAAEEKSAAEAEANRQAQEKQRVEEQYARDSNLLVNSKNGDATTVTLGVSAVLGGNSRDGRAAAQTIVSQMANGKPKAAVRGMHGLLTTFHEMQKSEQWQNMSMDQFKALITQAALSDGEGHKALQTIFNKGLRNNVITAANVEKVLYGVMQDQVANPQGFHTSLMNRVTEMRTANYTVRNMDAFREQITQAEKKVKEAKTKQANAQQTANDAHAKLEAVGNNLEAATSEYIPEDPNAPVVKENAGAVEQTVNELEGAMTAAQEADDAVVIQQQQVEEAQKELDKVREESLAQARAQAKSDVQQEQAQEAEAAYNEGVARLQPLTAFGRSITTYDSEGRPVKITGIYDATQGTLMPDFIYTTEDGRLVKERAMDENGNDIPEYGTVSTADVSGADQQALNDALDAQFRRQNARGVDNRHPAVAPKVYFPSSFMAEYNGEPVHMIGIEGKEDNSEDWSNPILIDINGNTYSTEDEALEIPYDYVDMVNDTFDRVQNALEITEASVNGAEENRESEVPVQGTEGAGNNEGELAFKYRPTVGRGSNGNAERGTDTNVPAESGRSAESEAGYNGQTESQFNGVHLDLIAERRPVDEKGNPTVKANNPNVQDTTDYGLFSNSLQASKDADPYGLFVDSQSVEDLQKKGAITLLSPDGMAGVAIGTKGEDKGNIFGVFNSPKNPTRNVMPYLMVNAISQGGNKLDCYDGMLSENYTRFGFIPVARVLWSDAYHQDDGWNYERDGTPDTIVWMHNGDSADTVARRWAYPEAQGGYHWYTRAEIEALPVIEDIVDEKGNIIEDCYTRALKFRDDLLAKRVQGDDLLYTHGMSIEHAMAALQEGGIAMPSIAITREGQQSGAYNFGSGRDGGVIALMAESSIDPSKDPRNFIFGDDAMTAMIPDNVGHNENGFYDKETGAQLTKEQIAQMMLESGLIEEGVTRIYKTLQEMKNDSGRIVGQNTQAFKASEALIGVDRASADLFYAMPAENQADFPSRHPEKAPAQGLVNYLSDTISTIYNPNMTAADMQKALAAHGINVSDKAAGEYKDAIDRAVGDLTDYMEAKPARVVGIDEIRGFVIPASATELAKQLDEKGIPYLTHDGKNRQGQTEALKKLLDNQQTPIDQNGNPVIEPKSDIQALDIGPRQSTPTRKQAEKVKATLKSPQQIAKKLAKDLGFGDYIGSNNFGNLSPGVQGYWSRHAKLLAVKNADMGDYTVTFHELGHGIAQTLGMTGTQNMVNNMLDAEPGFLTHYSQGQLRDEAMAEFMWRWMEDEQSAVDFAGQAFVDRFEKQLAQHPAMNSVIQNARADFQAFIEASVDDQVRATVQYETNPQTPKVKRMFQTLVTEIADSTAAAAPVDLFAKSNGALRNQALFANHSQKRAIANLTDSLTDADGKIIGDGLAKRFEDVGFDASKEEDLHQFERYALLLHALNRDEQNKPVFGKYMSKEDIEAEAKKIAAARPDIARAEKAYQEFKHDFLTAWMVDTGYWSADFLKHLEEMYPHYVPTYRVRSDQNGPNSTGFGRSAKRYTLKAATGGSEDIYSPMYSFISMVDQITSMVATNQIAQVFDQLYEDTPGMGIFGRRIPGATKNTLMPNGELNNKQKQLKELLKDKVSQDLMEQVMSITQSQPGVKQNNNRDARTLSVQRKDGTVVQYEIEAPELYKLLTGAQGSSGIRALQTVGQLTRTMSMLTTGSNPLFALRNAVRDYQNSVNYGTWASNYAMGIPKWIKAFADVARQTDEVKQYNAMGGGGWTRIQQGNTKSMKQITNEMFGDDRSTLGKTAKWLGKRVTKLVTMEWLNETIEQASRFAEYKYGKHDLSTTEGMHEAFQAAQDVTVDFSRNGNSELAYLLKKVVPFFNASMQGVYRTGRQLTQAERGMNVTDDQGNLNVGETLSNVAQSSAAKRLMKTIINTGLMSAIAAGLITRFGGDDDDKEEYNMLSDGIKANHLILPNPFGGEAEPPFIRIPLAQDPLGYAIHNLVTNALIDGTDDEMALTLAATADVILDNLNPLGSGTIMQPFIDVSHNRTWYGSNIVRTMQADWVDQSGQYNEDTPEVFKMLGRLFNKSPEVIEYLTSQYTGFIGAMAIPALSVNKDGSIGGFDALMNSIVKKWTSDPASSNDVTKDFYNMKNVINTITGEASADRPQGLLLRSLTQEQVDTAYEEAAAMMKTGGIVYETSKLINEAYKRIDAINSNTTLSDQDRAKLARDERLKMLEQVEAANEQMAAFYKKYVQGETLTDRAFGSLQKAFEGGKTVHIKDDLEKMPEVFQNDYDSVYMQRAVSVYEDPDSEGYHKTAAVPHPSQTFTLTDRNGNEDDYEISDDEWPYYTTIYEQTYQNYILSKGLKWDVMDDKERYQLLKNAHSAANKAMRERYAQNHGIRLKK